MSNPVQEGTWLMVEKEKYTDLSTTLVEILFLVMWL